VHVVSYRGMFMRPIFLDTTYVTLLKEEEALYGKAITELQSIICHMRSLNTGECTPARQASTQLTYSGGIEG